MLRFLIGLLFSSLTLMAHAQEAGLVLTHGNLITLKIKGDRVKSLTIKDGLILAFGDSSAVNAHRASNCC